MPHEAGAMNSIEATVICGVVFVEAGSFLVFHTVAYRLSSDFRRAVVIKSGPRGSRFGEAARNDSLQEASHLRTNCSEKSLP